jgi:hypothetical protein
MTGEESPRPREITSCSGKTIGIIMTPPPRAVTISRNEEFDEEPAGRSLARESSLRVSRVSSPSDLPRESVSPVCLR